MSLIDFFFYRGWRIGRHGKAFQLWKFRTMVRGADKEGIYSIADDDPRVTRIGKMLRKTHLDELPNIINVVKGDMALFGPRPEVPYFVERMPPQVRKVILSVKPGCIDKATMNNLNEGRRLKGQRDPDAFYEREIWPTKLKLQCRSILKISI